MNLILEMALSRLGDTVSLSSWPLQYIIIWRL